MNILMELVDKGINLSIVNDHQVDVLQTYKEELLHTHPQIQTTFPQAQLYILYVQFQ